MIKGFNSIKSQFKKFLFFNFSRESNFNPQQACNSKLDIHDPSQILLAAKYDQANHFRHYNYIQTQFSKALKQNKYQVDSKEKQQYQVNKNIVQNTLQVLSKYPMFQLDNESLKNYYKIITDNIHLKDNLFLEQFLIFTILNDNNAINSPVFIQFVKFYVQDNLELLKAELSIDLTQENLINTIKLFLFRMYQRGFLPRKPTYMRQLHVFNHALMLNTIVQNPKMLTTLFLKKVFHQKFSQIKQFYEQQMKENLYHQKNVILFEKLIQIIPCLTKSFSLNINLIEHSAKYLREIYIKLFLVIQNPSLKNTIFLYHSIKSWLVQGKLSAQLQQQIKDYLSKVQSTFISFAQQSQQHSQDKKQPNFIQKFSTEEIIVCLLNKRNLKLNDSLNEMFEKELSERFSSIIFKKHLDKLIEFFIYTKDSLVLIQKFYETSTYESLDLSEISRFSHQPIVKVHQKIKQSLLSSILARDIVNIGSRQLLNLLQIYKNTKLDSTLKNEKHIQSRQILIKFILRFIADHHENLPFEPQFQKILQQIFIHKSQANQRISDISFNDSQNNYPNLIIEQIQTYVRRYKWKIKNPELKKSIASVLG